MKITLLIALIFLLSFSGFAQVKTPTPPAVKIPFSQSRQTMVVVTKDWTATQGEAQLFERKNAGSKWKMFGEKFSVIIGKNGLAYAEDFMMEKGVSGFSKREGDGKSPAGMFPLIAAFGAGSKSTAIDLPFTQLDKWTECIDDPKSSHYNKIVNRMRVGNFDWKSSEKMLAVGAEYDLGIFVAHNYYPIKPGNGSCIFLHIWKAADDSTVGCTAMERANIEKFLGWLEPQKNPYLIQLPETEYKENRKRWNLPKFK